jgi:glycosyltransferase involved in cell wall biosynthesis
LEAWSCGKPVVGGQAHGVPELVEGSGGGLASSQDPAELGALLLRLLESPELRHQYGEAGRQLVESKYSVTAVTSALLSIYSDATINSEVSG